MQDAPFNEAVSNILAAALLLLPVLTIAVTIPAAYEMVNRYRRAMLRLMMTPASGTPADLSSVPHDLNPAPPQHLPADVLSVPLEVVTTATEVPADRPGAQALLERMTRGPRQVLGAFWLAGLAGALGGTVAVFLLDEESRELFLKAPVISTLAFGLMLCWPTALTHPLIAGTQAGMGRFRMPALYLIGSITALTLAVSAMEGVGAPAAAGDKDGMSTGMMLFVAMIIMLAPTLPLLFCSGRDTRAVGPVALCALTLALMGLPAAGILIAYVHFHPGPAGLGLLAWGGALLVVVLAAYLSWRMLQIGVQLYLRKAVSDQMMLVDVHWIILAVWLGLLLSLSVGGISGAFRLVVVLLPFLLYKSVLHLALHPQRRAAAQTERPLRMLLLRVFGSPERSEELFEGVAHHWRHVGSIQLIAGTDLAAMTIEPHEAITFLSGHLADTFVTGPDDLARRWEARDLAPDPDGRFRVNEFFCHDDTWQSVLVRLLTDSDVVLMDLRGFTPLRQGCVFELHRLVDSVPLGRILLLVDHTTDVPFLARVLEVAWDNRTPDSPNGDTEAPLIPLRLFQLPPRPGTAESRQLVRLLASAATVPAHSVSLTA